MGLSSSKKNKLKKKWWRKKNPKKEYNSNIVTTKNKNEDKNIKKLKIFLNDKTSKDNNDFNVLFIIDATGSISNYIKAAKDETKNISDDLRSSYPEMKFNYGDIFYKDPIDLKSDIHEFIDLTGDVNSLPKKIEKIIANWSADVPEDCVGAYKISNEKVWWRKGIRMMIHLADAGALGKLFTKYKIR